MSTQKQPQPTIAEAQYAGAIQQWLPSFYKLALKQWLRLPESIRSFYEIDDMVQDIILQLWTVRTEFNPERASIGTYLYTCARNQCFSISGYYRAQMRNPGVTVPAEDIADWLPAQHSELAQRQACSAVEHYIRHTDRTMGQALDNALRRHTTRGLQAATEALRALAKQHRVTRRDFELAMGPLQWQAE